MKSLVIVLLLLLISLPASALTLTFNNENDFNSSTNVFYEENFESLATTFPAQQTLISTSYFDVETQGIGGTSWLSIGHDDPAAGTLPTDGINALVAGYDLVDGFHLVFDLGVSVNSVGMYIVDFEGNRGGTLSIETNVGDSFLIASGGPDVIWPNANVMYFGLTNLDSTFNQFTLIQNSYRDGIAIDEIQLGSLATAPVPEPSTFILLGCGLAGLAFIVRRKKKS